MRLLAVHNPTSAPPSTALLSTIFGEFEKPRIARTSELVKRAREQGDKRVVSGVEACKNRNETVAAGAIGDSPVLKAMARDLIANPFRLGESEI